MSQKLQRNAAWNNVAAHVLEQSPDSISERMSLLADLVQIMPKSHSKYQMVVTSLRFLQHHQRVQMELPLALRSQGKGDQA